jgi:hypothetical protein
MDKWLKVNPKPEREEQHRLSIDNRYGKSDYTIIDLEYQVSKESEFRCLLKGKDGKFKNPRFDIIAVNKDGKLCVIELKKGSGALRGTSGLKEHYDCYKQSIDRNHGPFMVEMKKMLKQKQDFGLIDKRVEIKSSIPEFMFAYSYNSENISREKKAFDEAHEVINENIHLIELKNGSTKLLN